MTPENRFHDTPGGIIVDTEKQLLWLPKDSRLDLGKWLDWQGVLAYVRLMNQIYAGGFCDWRLPTKEEALSIYDETLLNVDWEKTQIHIHPHFVRGAAHYIWVNDINESGCALHLNLRDGSAEYIDKATTEHQAARLVRKTSQ